MAEDDPAAPEPPAVPPRIRLGISTCLLGENVRHDGGHKRDTFLTVGLAPWVEWVPVCPELEVGMGVPREPVRLVGSLDDPRMVGNRTGRDWTAEMKRWSAERIGELRALRLHGFVLTKNSPSCGMFGVKVYERGDVPASRRRGIGAPGADSAEDTERPRDDPRPPASGFARVVKKGRGLWAAALTAADPLLPVEEDGRLCDARLRENFVDRIFAHERWTRFLDDDGSRKGLVRFHTVHKLTLLSHSPDLYRKLGRVVADAGNRPLAALRDEYGRLFMEALAVPTTRGRHGNVLQHLAGFLKDVLDEADRRELHGQIDDYRAGLLPLVVPATLLRHHLRKLPSAAWALDQVWLAPYPRELMIRNHV